MRFEQAQLTCNEVWGGNAAADAALELPGLRGWVLSKPYQGAESGGDVYYVSSCGTGRITRLMLADVMGHGEEAAEMARYLRSLMFRYLNHIEPHTLASQVNELFNARSADKGRFATAVILTFFSPTGEMTLCNAGHPPPMIFSAEQRGWSRLERKDETRGPSDLPLGVDESGQYIARELTLDSGDVVLLYTDGLIEAKDTSGRQLGVNGLLELLAEVEDPLSWGHPGDLMRGVTKLLDERGFELSEDDLSLAVLQFVQPARGAGMLKKIAGTKSLIAGLLRGDGMPWPEMSWRNIGLHLFLPLKKTESRRG
ncbi:MAG: serine/threonine-protein phosphatase [Rhodospirillales bacterium]|nr:serine/threonine-protein phosphatase [Rhodospirillales bacterium]